MAESERCTRSRRADDGHSWAFDGDDPYIVCHYCKQRRDALSGRVIGEGLGVPRRIQMSRQQSWRAEHPHAVIVDRRTRWGNPFVVVRRGTSVWDVVRRMSQGDMWLSSFPIAAGGRESATRDAVDRFRLVLERDALPVTRADIRTALAGKDLACWCPLDQPCHAELLLDIANSGVAA